MVFYPESALLQLRSFCWGHFREQHRLLSLAQLIATMAQNPTTVNQDKAAIGSSSRVCATTGDEVEISNVCEAKCSATVHGVVLQLSPVKNNKLGTRKWFDGQICDWKSVVRMVSYNAKHWGAMEKSKEQSPIALCNCSIQQSKHIWSGSDT